MNIDTGEDGEECLLGSITDSHLMKMIVVQDSVVYSFCRCPVVINLFYLSDLYGTLPKRRMSSPSLTYTVLP